MITRQHDPPVFVDSLKLAHFIYLLTEDADIRETIDTITSKVVLILGRFTADRKAVLVAIRNALRSRRLLPVVFDFDGPATKDTTGTGKSLGSLVDAFLSEALELERHSLFQASTSNALVKAVFDGSTTVGELRSRGDFGLGTFDRLDGEMILIEGGASTTAEGFVTPARDDREVPFALVIRFEADVIDSEVSFDGLTARLDGLRPSPNLFAALRVQGSFDELSLRAACPTRPGEGLVEATSHQSEFEAGDIRGTLAWFWAPEYARAVSVPG